MLIQAFITQPVPEAFPSIGPAREARYAPGAFLACFARGGPGPSCSIANRISDESSRRAAVACFFASDIHGPRSVKKRLNLSLGTMTNPTSMRPSRNAECKWIMSTTKRSLLAETCTSTPTQTRVPLIALHFTQSISPETFLVHPPSLSNCSSMSFRTAAPPFESICSLTRRGKPVMADRTSSTSGARPSRSIRSLAPL